MRSSSSAPTYPGYINVIALDAAWRSIQSAMVHTNERQKRAAIELGFYLGVTREHQREAAKTSRDAVLKRLGEGWTASFQKA